MTEPCRCLAPNPECLRAGRPMVEQFWEICSGNCSLPRAEQRSEQARAEWDRRNVAIAAGQDPLPRRPIQGLGDVVEKALEIVKIKPAIEKLMGGPCGSCEERRERLNKLGRWAKRIVSRKGTETVQ